LAPRGDGVSGEVAIRLRDVVDELALGGGLRHQATSDLLALGAEVDDPGVARVEPRLLDL
jgi:hypothetical protein